MQADTITILHPKDESGDKDVELNRTGFVYPKKNEIKVREPSLPDWFQAGTEIVATDMNGNTIDGFVVAIKVKAKPMKHNEKVLELETNFPP